MCPSKLAGWMFAMTCAAVASAATPVPAILKRIAVPASAAQCVAVDPILNKVYVSGGASANQQVVKIDVATYEQTVLGPGSCASVDLVTHHVWAAGVYDGSALVYDGSTGKLIRRIPLGGCPVSTAYDSSHGRAWIGAQCGANNDPVFAVNGSTYRVDAGPIGSGGVFSVGPIANPATGRVYFGASNNGRLSSLCIDTDFAKVAQPFGGVGAVDATNGMLFAVASGDANELEVVSEGSCAEWIVRTIKLPFTAGALAVSPALGHLYAANPQGNSIEVVNEKTGTPLTRIPVGAGSSPFRLAADTERNRLYALVQTAAGTQLLVIQDVAMH